MAFTDSRKGQTPVKGHLQFLMSTSSLRLEVKEVNTQVNVHLSSLLSCAVQLFSLLHTVLMCVSLFDLFPPFIVA